MMRHSRFILFFLLLGRMLSAQTDLTLYQLTNVPGSNLLNPGFRAEAHTAIGLPGLSSFGLQLHNSGFKLIDLIGPDVQDVNLAIQEIAASMSDVDQIALNMRPDLMYIGFGVGSGFISMGAGTYTSVQMEYPADLLQFLWPGTDDFSEMDINLSGVNYEVLNATFFHFGYQQNLFREKLSLGVRAKYFFGIQNAYIEDMTAGVSSNRDEMLAETDILIRTAGVESLTAGNIDDWGAVLFPENTGLAFDFGFTYSITDRWELSASVLNMGSIEYKEDVLEQTSKGTYSFQGVAYDPSNEALNFDDLTSELDSTFGFVERSGGSYKRKLPREIYASLTHSFNQRHHLSATYHMRSWNSNNYHDMGFSYQAKLGKTFHFVAGYNMINGIWNNISGGFALNMGGFQWHLMSDDVYGLIVPGKTSTINIRTGFSFRFGRDRIKDRKYSHPPILPVPAGDQVEEIQPTDES